MAWQAKQASMPGILPKDASRDASRDAGQEDESIERLYANEVGGGLIDYGLIAFSIPT